MASSGNDDHLDDVIGTLDLSQMKCDEEIDAIGGEEVGVGEGVSIDGDTSAKKSHNLKKLMPSKGQETSGAKGGGADGAANGSGTSGKDSRRDSTHTDRWKILKEVKVEKLPQGFVCKYVGSKPCTGLWGVRHTRQPVDQLVTELRKLGEGEDLPLVNVKVSAEGLKATLHMHNKSTRPLSDVGLLPLQFISYAVQDPRYTRIFVFILVREMSSRERKTECHAYLCSTDVFARKMALSMALAFQEFGKKLAGKPHRFQVDLRNTDELESELSTNAFEA